MTAIKKNPESSAPGSAAQTGHPTAVAKSTIGLAIATVLFSAWTIWLIYLAIRLGQ